MLWLYAKPAGFEFSLRSYSKAGCDLACVSIFTPKSTTTHARTCKTSQVAAVRKFACTDMRKPWKNPLTCGSIAYSTVQPSSISDFPAFEELQFALKKELTFFFTLHYIEKLRASLSHGNNERLATSLKRESLFLLLIRRNLLLLSAGCDKLRHGGGFQHMEAINFYAYHRRHRQLTRGLASWIAGNVKVPAVSFFAPLVALNKSCLESNIFAILPLVVKKISKTDAIKTSS